MVAVSEFDPLVTVPFSSLFMTSSFLALFVNVLVRDMGKHKKKSHGIPPKKSKKKDKKSHKRKERKGKLIYHCLPITDH